MSHAKSKKEKNAESNTPQTTKHVTVPKERAIPNGPHVHSKATDRRRSCSVAKPRPTSTLLIRDAMPVTRAPPKPATTHNPTAITPWRACDSTHPTAPASA